MFRHVSAWCVNKYCVDQRVVACISLNINVCQHSSARVGVYIPPVVLADGVRDTKSVIVDGGY